ncbi:MAG: hypothetical protein WD844_02820 [Thermoleophilaceae bacterium]
MGRGPSKTACGSTLPGMPRFWIAMQVVIVVCVIASMVIAVTKL